MTSIRTTTSAPPTHFGTRRPSSRGQTTSMPSSTPRPPSVRQFRTLSNRINPRMPLVTEITTLLRQGYYGERSG